MKLIRHMLIVVSVVLTVPSVFAQTDIDGIMMSKNQFCTGLMYGSGNWKKYWEGTNYRENLNLGTLSSSSINVMGNYGLKDNLNMLFNVPHISNNASRGTLNKMNGIQDLSAWIKWMPIEKDLKYGTFSLYLLTGASTPLTDYIVDYLPLSIGLKSNTVSGRLMLDYQYKSVFVTASETYSIRGNTKLERNSYYTTQLYLTNLVDMPNVNMVNFRAGYRSYWFIAEAIYSDMRTLGGFDITRNNMPFPSNRMNASSVGFNFKLEIPKVSGLSLVGGGSHVIKGRNVGQTTAIYGGMFYILDFSKKSKNKSETNNSSTEKK